MPGWPLLGRHRQGDEGPHTAGLGPALVEAREAFVR